MKKTIFIIVALATFTLGSCQKEYACTCRYDSNGTIVSASTVTASKKKATESCSQGNVSGISTCTID